jgi:hypothetical protein
LHEIFAARRQDAHRFHFREKMAIFSYSFIKKVFSPVMRGERLRLPCLAVSLLGGVSNWS